MKAARSEPGTDIAPQKSAAILILILLVVAVRSVLLAVSRTFWNDEVITVIVCRLPSVKAIWNALDHAIDGQSLFFYVAERLARHVIPDDHLGYRVLSILAVLVTIACVYLILSRRVTRLAALAGASFVSCTILTSRYAAEARPYALVVACIALAFFAWQCLDDSRLHALLLAVSLAAAVSFNYYAILVWPAFLVAEFSFWVLERRFRVSAWAALAAGALPMILFAHFLLRLRLATGAHFWAKATTKYVLLAHNYLFNLPGYWGSALAVGVTVILLFGLWKGTRTSLAGGVKAEPDKVPAAEVILALMLLWIPLVGFAVGEIGGSGMTERYVMATILGGALAVGYVVDGAPRHGKELVLALLLLVYLASFRDDLRSYPHGALLKQRADAARDTDMIAELTHDTNLPIVIANERTYLPMVYYTPAGSRGRLFTLVDPAAALTYSSAGSDTVDTDLRIIRNYFPLQAEDYASFVSTHREFLLVTNGADPYEWLPARLMHEGYSLKVVSFGLPDGLGAAYEVSERPAQ